MKRKDTVINLAKKLKAIKLEIKELYDFNTECNIVPAEWEYDNGYDYDEVFSRIEELYKEEQEIKNAISKFNLNTMIEGYSMTVAEGLVRLGQLKELVATISVMASKPQYFVKKEYGEHRDLHCMYVTKKVKEDLKKYQSEKAKLQVAIDKTNMINTIEY